METKFVNEDLIVRYLLGDLPEEEQARLEDLAFSDREYMQIILDAENDLIDEYALGEFPDYKRRQFESRFLASPERRQKVEFARALAKVNSKAATEKAVQPVMAFKPTSWWNSFAAFLNNLNPAVKFSMVAATAVLVIGISWLITETIRLRAQVSQIQTAQQTRQQREEILQQQVASERARNEDLAAQLQREREERERSEELAAQLQRDKLQNGSTGLSFIASVFLPPGIGRGGADRPTLVVPQAARLARLQIGLERGDEYQSFRVGLRTVQGQEVWTQDHLRPRQSRAGRVINLAIPGRVFNEGKYELTLKGITDNQNTEDVRYYYFDVLKK